MNNARIIYEGLKESGYTVFGGVNAPYIWLKTPDHMDSWQFFDYLLEEGERGWNARLWFWTQRGGILPADGFWKLREHEGCH